MQTVMTKRPPFDVEPIVDAEWWGERYQVIEAEDGSITTKVIPLRPEDILSPEEGDQVSVTREHELTCSQTVQALRALLIDSPDFYVAHELRIAWLDRSIVPLTPDIAIVRGPVPPPKDGSLYLSEVGGSIEWLIEVTSPGTRHLEFRQKLDLYHRAGVPRVAVIDAARPRTEKIDGIHLYLWAEEDYERVVYLQSGSFKLTPLEASLAILEGEIKVLDAAGTPVPDLTETRARLAATEEALQAETARAEAEQQRAEAEAARAEAEQQRAEAALAELEQLREQLRIRAPELFSTLATADPTKGDDPKPST